MSSAYYVKNREKLLEYQRQYRAANREKIRTKMKEKLPEYYEKNKSAYKSRNQQWRQANPARVAYHSRIRDRVLKLQTPPWAEHALIDQLYKKRDELNKALQLDLQVDHVIPLVSDSVCGLHCWNNLQLLEGSLNAAKATSYETDW